MADGTKLARQSRTEVEVMEDVGGEIQGNASAHGALYRAELDTRIATAKAFPRDLKAFMRAAADMIEFSPEVAEECRYKLPAPEAKKGQPPNDPIEGPSVRLAEIAFVCWGNLEVEAGIIDDDGSFVTAKGTCRDLERNTHYSETCRRSVTTRGGYRFSANMVAKTSGGAQAIAKRNAIFNVIPKTFIRALEQVAINTVAGDARPVSDRATQALKWFASKGAKEADIYRVLGVDGMLAITADHLATLNGYKTAIKDGVGTVESIFVPAPPVTAIQPGESKVEAMARNLAGAREEAPKAKEEPELRGSTEDDAPWDDTQEAGTRG